MVFMITQVACTWTPKGMGAVTALQQTGCGKEREGKPHISQ